MAFLTDEKPRMGHPLFQLADALVGLKRRAKGAGDLETLPHPDDYALREFGMTHDQVQDTLKSPTSQDAADALHRLSLHRRAPWM